MIPKSPNLFLRKTKKNCSIGPNVREADSDAITDNMVQSPDSHQQTAVKLGSETHAGEDVALYATGPGSERFNGVMEQNKIGEIIGELIAK